METTDTVTVPLLFPDVANAGECIHYLRSTASSPTSVWWRSVGQRRLLAIDRDLVGLDVLERSDLPADLDLSVGSIDYHRRRRPVGRRVD